MVRPDPDSLTTGEVARLLCCSARTVGLWVDEGLLPGWRLPSPTGGPGHRRVSRGALLTFLAAHGFPDEVAARVCNYTRPLARRTRLPEGPCSPS